MANPSGIDLGLGKVTRKGTQVFDQALKVSTSYTVDRAKGMWLLLWMAGAAVLGWQGFHMYHGDLNTDCLVGTMLPHGLKDMSLQQVAASNYTLSNGTMLQGAAIIDYGKTAPSCNPYGMNYYYALGVAGFVVVSYMYERQTTEAIQMPFVTATWEFQLDMFALKSPMDLPDIRMWQYLAHAITGALFFALWYYVDGDSPESKALVYEGSRSLTAFARFWIAVIPTVVAEIGSVRLNNLSKEEWRMNHMKWAAMSIFNKTIILLVLHFIIDPQTQMLWLHADETGEQRNWVIGITAALGAGMTLFWYYYLSSRYSAGKKTKNEEGVVLQELQNRVWAYVDFPVNLVIVAMVAYNLTARLHDEHGPTHLPSDFHAALLYLTLVLVGILNIPVNVTNAVIHSEAEEGEPDASNPTMALMGIKTEMVTIHSKKPTLKTAEEVAASNATDGL